MIVRVALDVPLPGLFDYRCESPARVGQRVCVPWGRAQVIGLVAEIAEVSEIEPARLKDVVAVLDDVPDLGPDWWRLVDFAAQYYQRSLGEVALPALPTTLRRAAGYRWMPSEGRHVSRSMRQLRKRVEACVQDSGSKRREAGSLYTATIPGPILNSDQLRAVARVTSTEAFDAFLLHGVTGSGKTEVYLHAVEHTLSLGRQSLILVPEINLTPQLVRVFEERFPHTLMSILHSGLADAERAQHWLLAHEGHARIVLGTRMAVLASIPHLGLIIVDEEHDASFKQQEGLRYSARDLAVVRARQSAVPIVLGSATPSLESWAQAKRGRYQLLALTRRASDSSMLPALHLVSLARNDQEHGFTARLREAIALRLERREQVLIFHNRRGYAPVLHCGNCGWVSDCRQCSAHMVYHKHDGCLHCHHCGLQVRTPRACPECGNVDLRPLGRGTQRIEEALSDWYPEARILRIDRDSTRGKGSTQALLSAVHAGEVDILVGTQMIAKGHDFRHLTLVGVLDADTALFSHDFRAAERLFASLMQVSGRAGRAGLPGEVLVQTRFPEHPVYTSLAKHDYTGFADEELRQRRASGLPPFAHQAMLRAEAVSLDLALDFLREARACASTDASPEVRLFDAVPMSMVRLAKVERAQLMVESASRPALQAFLPGWLNRLRAIKTKARWHLEVDPLDI